MAGEETFAATVGDVDPGGFAARIGLRAGDVVLEVNGVRPRDILEWRGLVDANEIEIVADRAGAVVEASGVRATDESFGASISSALFDRIHTCDNHCEFCFIYQLPKGLRRSLYTKDDDYRLSFLFGNFTTLTRFTEADLERVIGESLSPLHVSIHDTDPVGRAEMLRNLRGGTSLRWLGEILRAGISVKGQIVLCPGVNDSAVLDETLADVAEQYPQLAEIAVVPLGLSRHNTESRMRVHDAREAAAVIDQIDWWRDVFRRRSGRPMVHAADELYVLAGREFPDPDYYGSYAMAEDGVGLARSFIEEFRDPLVRPRTDAPSGFFASVDGSARTNPTEYAAPQSRGPANPAVDSGLRPSPSGVSVALRPRATGPAGPVFVVTGGCAASMLRGLVAEVADGVGVIEVENRFFGGNTSVAGLLCGPDLARSIGAAPADATYLLPDVCLNQGRFLDGSTLEDLRAEMAPRVLEVIEARGSALRARLDAVRGAATQTREVRDDVRV